MYSLFALIEHILRVKDGHTLLVVIAVAMLAATVEFEDLAAPDLDESSMDQASLALGEATLALALQAPSLPARMRRTP
jgi:hypothetical protein